MIDQNTRIVGIVGPTASGKSELGISLAQKFGGEIICADSRTLYRGMDIGTAKPGFDERKLVAHHMLDVANPNEPLSAGEFKRRAETAMAEIAARGKIAFIIGGSGLYIYGVIYDFRFPAGPRTSQRKNLESYSLDALVQKLRAADAQTAEEVDLKNKRRVVRALETIGQPRLREMKLGSNCLLVGLRVPEKELHTRIIRRSKQMLEAGLIDEVRKLVDKYGSDLEVMRSPGYFEVVQLLNGELSEEDTLELIALHTRQLAKRQMTWFKRNPEIRWFESSEDAEAAITEFLKRKEV